MQKTQTLNLAKYFYISLSLLIAASCFLSFKMRETADDLWNRLGISQTKGEDNIRTSFINGYFSYYGARSAKNILVQDRRAVAKDLMAYTKNYLASEAFLNEYKKQRARAKPVEHPYLPKSKEEIRAEKVAELNKSIKSSEEMIVKMPDMEKTMKPLIEQFKQNLKDYQDPNSEMIEMFYQNELQIKAQREQSYAANMKRWQQDFPEDPQQLIKARLQKFLSLAKTVDFNARLKEVNGKKIFVNPKYEGQSAEWKMIFRAGREVIQPAVEFAEKWIVE